MKLFPSLLAANFSCLRESLLPLVENGFTDFHLDVMDGNFVPNISFGPPVVRSLRTAFGEINLDAHLMVESPEVVLEPLLGLELDWLSVHVEIDPQLEEIKSQCADAKTELGLVFNPQTPVEPYRDYLQYADFVLLMAVQPGFGGQQFKPKVLEKITTLRRYFSGPVQMDGGLGPGNLKQVREAGVDWIVAGSAVFGADDPLRAAEELRSPGD